MPCMIPPTMWMRKTNNVDEEEEQYLNFIAEQENNGGEDDEGEPQRGRARIGLANLLDKITGVV